MKKIKYYFDSQTLRYERLTTPLRVKLLRFFAFIVGTIVTAALIVVIAFQYIDSPKTIMLEQQNVDLRDNYAIVQQQVNALQQQMDELVNRDNNVYRSIFESSPIPDSARLKAMEKIRETQMVSRIEENDLLSSIGSQLNRLTKLVAYQQKSFADIETMVQNKEKLLAAIPAIQPVSDKDLTRVASGFGTRIDPVYKVPKFHAGLDFTAPVGTPIYATADGLVTDAGYNAGGYGNRIIIDHGFGYETLYGHMYRIKAKKGQHVKRGEVIGYVGSTGKSTGPHCHYEVHRSETPVDPVYYFYNDLTPEQYDRLLKLAQTANQSFD